MGVPTSFITPGRLAALVIAGIAAIELVLIGAVLSPRTFFSGDGGVKYLQAEALVRSGWRELSVPDPGAAIDPDGRFSAFKENQFTRRSRGAPWYGHYSEVFVLPVSVGFAALGLRGLYLVPFLAGIATMVLTYRLTARAAPRWAWTAPALLGLCTPFLFYSLELWEHTLAALFVMTAVVLVVPADGEVTVRRYGFAGLCLALAIVVREEHYAMVPVALLALLWVERGQRLRAALAGLAGSLAILVPHWLLKYWQAGRPARFLVSAVLGIVEPEVVGRGAPPDSRRAALELIIPSSTEWIAVMALVIACRLAVPRLRLPLQRWCAAGLLAGIVAAALMAALRAQAWVRPDSIAAAFPLTFTLLLLVAPQRLPRQIRRLLAICAVFVATLCLAIMQTDTVAPAGGAQWGPRLLLAAMPLLVACTVYAFEHRAVWQACRLGSRIVAVTFVIAAAASVWVQTQGVRELREAKRQYEQLLARTDVIAADQVVISGLWWYPMIAATALDGRPLVATDDFDSLDRLLRLLNERGVAAATVVASCPKSDAAAARFAMGGWTEASRSAVRIWLDVCFVEYRRGANVLSLATEAP